MPCGKGTSSKTTKKHLTKEERAIRETVEDNIKGMELTRNAPSILTVKQRVIYRWLYDNLAPSNILGNLDIQSMIQASIIIERLNSIDASINEKLENENCFDKGLEAIRKDYFNQYLKICAEMCLSPASRAKIGSLALSAHKAKGDALVEALGGS